MANDIHVKYTPVTLLDDMLQGGVLNKYVKAGA